MIDSSPKDAHTDPLRPKDKSQGGRVNGKDWKIQKDAFRVKRLSVKPTTYKQREEQRNKEKAIREKIKELKEEKSDDRKTKLEARKKREEAKAEKERYALLATKMHAKKVDRMRRREKRRKALQK